VADNKHTVRA